MHSSDSFPLASLQFLKFGGSLITDKHQPHTARLDVLSRLSREVAAAWNPDLPMQLILGNGAGSFGHIPAKKYGTRQGVHTRQEWAGFAEVWREAAALNSLVIDSLHAAGLPAIAIHPSAVVTAHDGQVAAWDLAPIKSALQAGLLPVIHGDVIFDSLRGGTILSTEDLFDYLAKLLLPQRILLAGLEEGVWADYPVCTRLVPVITPENILTIMRSLGGSGATDVTGGMQSKVQQSLELVAQIPDLEVFIFSGETPGAITEALCGARLGTCLHR
jgi:isopentenyl phosphate kinase